MHCFALRCWPPSVAEVSRILPNSQQCRILQFVLMYSGLTNWLQESRAAIAWRAAAMPASESDRFFWYRLKVVSLRLQ